MDQRIEFAIESVAHGQLSGVVYWNMASETGYKWRERLLHWGTEGWWSNRADREGM